LPLRGLKHNVTAGTGFQSAARKGRFIKMKGNAFLRTLIMGMAFAAVLASCATTGGTAKLPANTAKAAKQSPPVLAPRLVELLGKYMGPKPQDWLGGTAYIYFLDPLHFEEFKAEVDAAGEYRQIDRWNELNEYNRGRKPYVRWVFEPNGKVQFDHWKEDDSLIGYKYIKVGGASGTKTEELFRKYMGQEPEFWDGEGKRLTYVYYLDPLRFEAFKAELDGGGEYQQTANWTEKRDWGKGVAFARWAVRPNGEFELRLCKADNSTLGYRYKKAK
jgi:hypothetical protein